MGSHASPKVTYPALTGLRALAAWMVFFFHYPLVTEGAGAFLFKRLDAGVSLFFVLSGFLIALRYEGEACASSDWVIKYLRNRFARIFPVYLLVLAVAFVVIKENDWRRILINVTLLSGFFFDTWIRVAVSWSLTVELCFYFLAPLLLLRAKSVSSLFGVWLAFAILGLLIGNTFADARFVLERTILGRIGEFLIGIQCARLWRRTTPQNWLHSFRHKSVVGLGGIFIYLCLAPSAEAPVALVVLKGVMLPLFGALFITGLASEAGVLARLLASRPFDVLGKASYSFYLIHLGVFSGVVVSRLGLGIGALFVLANLASIAIYYAFERPAEAWLKNRFQLNRAKFSGTLRFVKSVLK